MNIKLLAFDLDGTALTEEKTISEGNRAAFCRAYEAGVLLVPATGRIRCFLPPDVTALPGIRYAITSNGGAVVDFSTGETLLSALIPHETALVVQKILDDYEVYLEYYVNGIAYTLSGNPQRMKEETSLPPSKRYFYTKPYSFVENYGELLRDPAVCPEKINLPHLPDPDMRRELAERIGAVPGLKLTSSVAENLEINASTATKGQALQALCRLLGLRREECMSIGDNGNDEDMLAWAGVSVAMGNSSPEALRAARCRTASFRDDGVALAITRFLL